MFLSIALFMMEDRGVGVGFDSPSFAPPTFSISNYNEPQYQPASPYQPPNVSTSIIPSTPLNISTSQSGPVAPIALTTG